MMGRGGQDTGLASLLNVPKIKLISSFNITFVYEFTLDVLSVVLHGLAASMVEKAAAQTATLFALATLLARQRPVEEVRGSILELT